MNENSEREKWAIQAFDWTIIDLLAGEKNSKRNFKRI